MSRGIYPVVATVTAAGVTVLDDAALEPEVRAMVDDRARRPDGGGLA
jgi:hypothetical protein